MTDQGVIVRRSGWRAWAVAMLSIPLLVIAVDVLTNRRITDFFRGLLFRPDDTQLFEPRDVIWVAAMGVVGLVFALWGLRELLAPTPVLSATADGLALRLGGPLSRSTTTIPWDDIDDLGAGTVDDDGDRVPVLWVRVFDKEAIAPAPWGARWVDDRTLAVFAADWERPAAEVAPEVVEVAVASAGRGIRDT